MLYDLDKDVWYNQSTAVFTNNSRRIELGFALWSCTRKGRHLGSGS